MTSPVRHQWLSGDINSAFCGGKVIRSLQCVLQIQQATNIFHWCIYNSQCFQPILCKNLSSCLYKSWFDWKETLRLQIKNLSRYHTQRFSKQISHLSSFNFKKLLFKFGCVVHCCIAPGNLLYSDARLMRLLDEVGSQSLTLRSQCTVRRAAGDWALTSVPQSSLHPQPQSVGNWHSGDSSSRGISATLVTFSSKWFIEEMTPKEVSEGWLHCCQLLDKTSERWVRGLPMLHCPIYS